ncbi:myosin-1B isoform X2 [Oryzias latipes]|uniref:myosin-1B isoform X2 n=1 Tax=Oryzias latipes TaxID=8090 RepID=UPI0009DB0EE5|nr:myosin-1B isoform X2 [Oryzias latipes]
MRRSRRENSSYGAERQSMMFRPSYKRSSPFSLLDPDMWDTKSDFEAQTTRLCGTSTVTGSESMSKASASSDHFRWNEPSLRRWQSLSRLPVDNVAWPASPSGGELRTARSRSVFPQMDVLLWLQDAQEEIDSHLDWFSTRDLQLDVDKAPAHVCDSKQKPSSVRSAGENAAEDCGELYEKVLRLEKDLFQMRSALSEESRDQAVRLSAPDLLNKTPTNTQDNFDKQKSESNLYEMREALREAKAKVAAYEEEGNKTLQQLQTAAETQRTMQNQIDEMKMRLSQSVHNHSDERDQLSEANNKISQASLEKAVLSTQVLKLEDNVRDLTAKLTAALLDRESLIQEKQKLRGELQLFKKNLDVPQEYLQELEEETKRVNSKQIFDLKEQHSQMNREKVEQLNERKEEGDVALLETQDQCCRHRESVDVLQKEKQEMHDHLQLLEAQVEEKERRFLLQEEEYRKQDAARVQCIQKLKAVASHWTEKWQKVALTLKSTLDELDEFKRNSRDETDSCAWLRAELATCRQELEQERSRSQVLLQQLNNKGVELEQTLEKEQVTDFSDSSSILFDSQSCQNEPPQVWRQSSDVEMLRKQLTEKEKELSEKEQALKSLEKLRETEKQQSEMKISDLELKLTQVSENCQNHGGLQAEDLTSDSLRLQLHESRKRAEQLEREKTLVAQKLQAMREQLSVVKDDKPLVEGRKEKTVDSVNPETERQRRLVTEQLKSLFRKQEEKEAERVSETAASQVGASSSQDWTASSSALRGDRHYLHQGSGLVTLFEEDEESAGSAEEEEEEEAEDAHIEISVRSSEISTLRAKCLQKALKSRQPDQEAPSPDETTKMNVAC